MRQIGSSSTAPSRAREPGRNPMLGCGMVAETLTASAVRLGVAFLLEAPAKLGD